MFDFICLLAISQHDKYSNYLEHSKCFILKGLLYLQN